jgi:hypothetical protein
MTCLWEDYPIRVGHYNISRCRCIGEPELIHKLLLIGYFLDMLHFTMPEVGI